MAAQIVELFEALLLSRSPEDLFDKSGRENLNREVQAFVETGSPVQFLFAGFPFKSPSPQKTTSIAADMAEHLAFVKLAQFSQAVEELYEPGVVFHIFSDGRVYSDLLLVPEENVQIYIESSINMSKELCPSIQWHSLDDLLPKHNEKSVRQVFLDEHGREEALVLKEIQSMPNRAHVFQQYQVNVRTDLAENPLISETSWTDDQIQQKALQMMIRHDALNSLLDKAFQMPIRLSIHKTDNNQRFSICLLSNLKGESLNPWHAAAIKKDEETWICDTVSNLQLHFPDYRP